MNVKLKKRLQAVAVALLLALVAGCSSTTTDSAATERPPGTFTIREHNVLRISSGGVGEGTLVFRGWQHTFVVENMILGAVGRDSVELKGDVWNLETLEDFAGTYHPVTQEYEGRKGLSGVWMENENGVRVQVRTVGQDLSVRVDPAGSIVTLK